MAKNTATGTDAANDATYESSETINPETALSIVNADAIASVRSETPVAIQKVCIAFSKDKPGVRFDVDEETVSEFDVDEYGFNLGATSQFVGRTAGFSGAARTTHHFKHVNSRPPLQPMVIALVCV
ncbi:MAG: hypothetical protein AAGG48_32075 [Planctomycetota bacterium]